MIDGRSLLVIANDLVPVIPYVTDSVVLGGGQRYDIIVEANQTAGNYWMRANMEDCNIIFNANWDNIKGIIRYEGADGTSDPATTQSSNILNGCYGTALSSLTLHLSKTVGLATSEETLDIGWYYDIPAGLIYYWTINTQRLEIGWAEPTLQIIENGISPFPTTYDVKEITTFNQVCSRTLLALLLWLSFNSTTQRRYKTGERKANFNPVGLLRNPGPLPPQR